MPSVGVPSSVMSDSASLTSLGSTLLQDSKPCLQGLSVGEGPDRRGENKGEKMKSNSTKASARLSQNGKYLIVESNGQSTILNANLVRYLFDVPYTRKDGTHVSNNQIFEMKQRARAAYDSKIQATVK